MLDCLNRDGLEAQDAMLNPEELELLKRDLEQPPSNFGYASRDWTGALLAKHLLRRCGVSYTARHCRRLLYQFETRWAAPIRRAAKPNSLKAAPVTSNTSAKWPKFSDFFMGERALRHIRRLATAQLPMAPFIWNVFELLGDAIELGGAPQALIERSTAGFRWLFRDLDPRSMIGGMEAAHVFSKDAEVSGMRTRLDDVPNFPRLVIESGELMSENFHRCAAYAEFYRPLNLHLGMVGILREHGETLGALPVWKGQGARPFSVSDTALLRAAVPHIAHGLQVARLLGHGRPDATEGFSPSRSAAVGLVILNSSGRVIAADERARAIFAQIGVFDGCPTDAFTAAQIRTGFEYIRRTTHTILFDAKSSSDIVMPPVVKVWSHQTGITVRLRGHIVEDAVGREMMTIFVEEGEPLSLVRQRLRFRFGLSAREVEVLTLLRQNIRRSAIAKRLGISSNTLKTYVRQISTKLRDCGQPFESVLA